ncbi:TPA: hypothetical protein IAA86_01835 [Candidatus Galligastranaerophilus intestinavium]|uniref:Uncharacterized protein n=1 Tax=Candidatus Galligastranaerophilus intestinavium TaxID=2840836 RepID=A0A9D1JX41_9BACT|nr:hypothetical protein [Candidatus Galligastranaerophilus intestinavium]
MSSINNNYLLKLLNSGNLDLSNLQKSVESTQNGLFDLNSLLSGDSFISKTSSANMFDAINNYGNTTGINGTNGQLSGMTDQNGYFVATGSYASQIQQYQQYIAQLEQQIQEYEQQLQEYKTQLETEKANLEATNEKIATAQQELENYENQKQAKEAEYNNILAQINQAKVNNEDGKQDVIINNLTTQLNTLSTEICTLNTNISNKKAQIQTYQSQAATIQATIADLEEKINTTETLKSTAEAQKCDAQQKLCQAQKAKAAEDAAKARKKAEAAAESKKETQEKANITDGESLMSQLSDETKDYIKDNNIDLTETYENGNAKYAIAPGDTDGEYHVYEMDESGTNGSSITQAKQGNNNLYGMQDCDDGVNVYTVTDTNNDLSDCDYECSTKSYNTASPLSFDLEGDGVKTSDELIRYDIDGDGDLDTINDSADAILVFDADGDGISGEDGSECFGDNTDLDGDGVADGYKDGFEALKALANKEGLVDGVNDNTLDVDDLKILEEKYGLQIKTDGYNSEGSSLFEAGITEINLATTDETTLHKNYDSKSNDLMTQEGATFVVNGEEREYADIWHAMKDE